MNKITAALISVVTALVLVTPALAIDSTSSTTVKPQTTQLRLQNKQLIEQRKLMEASKAAMFRQRLEDVKGKIASREAEMKLKFQAFKDRQKAAIAQRVNTNLNKINQNQTDMMIKNLDRMSLLLDKLANRVSEGTADVKDPAAANQAIADARAAIDTARTAVQAQTQKDYTIAITTEAQIRSDAQTQREQLYKDIMATRKLVIDARQATVNAVRVTKGGSNTATGSSQMKEGTTSGQR